MELKKAALVLEGGANLGVFTSGAVDYLMKRDCYFPYVVGVSCGACNSVDYLSRQPGRTKDCMIIKEKAYRTVTLRGVIKNKSLYDMDMLFDKFPNEYFPFDYDTYFASNIKSEYVVTNCLTGKAEYLSESEDRKRLMDICRASSSLPLAAPVVWIDSIPYMDGGMADSIPIVHSLRLGYKKNVIILTKEKGYRKKHIARQEALVSVAYKNYPLFVRAVRRRPEVYNRTMEFVEDLERRGHVFVIRPNGLHISHAEYNMDKLQAFYDLGYDTMEKQFDKMMEYLNK